MRSATISAFPTPTWSGSKAKRRSARASFTASRVLVFGGPTAIDGGKHVVARGSRLARRGSVRAASHGRANSRLAGGSPAVDPTFDRLLELPSHHHGLSHPRRGGGLLVRLAAGAGARLCRVPSDQPPPLSTFGGCSH